MITRISYDKWFLNNLESVQKTLQNRQAAASQKSAEKAELRRRYDTVEISEDAYKAAAAKQSHTEQAVALPVNETQAVSSADDGFDLMSIIQVSSPQASKESDDYGTGLLDLIDSGSIDYEKIKPVERNVGRAYSQARVSASATSLSENLHPTPAMVDIPAEVLVEDAEAPRLSEPISRKETHPGYGEEKTKAAEEAENRSMQQKLTAAQQQGVQTYQRIQSYANPYTMSLNMAYSVA